MEVEDTEVEDTEVEDTEVADTEAVMEEVMADQDTVDTDEAVDTVVVSNFHNYFFSLTYVERLYNVLYLWM